MLIRKSVGLNKAQKVRLLDYLVILERNIPQPAYHIKTISDRMKKRQLQKARNYLHAIAIIRYIIDPCAGQIPNFKTTMHYTLDNENIQLHSKGRSKPLRKIPKRKQLEAIKSVSSKNVPGLPILQLL